MLIHLLLEMVVRVLQAVSLAQALPMLVAVAVVQITPPKLEALAVQAVVVKAVQQVMPHPQELPI